MTDDRSLERAARSWIEAGPTRAPDQVVEAALRQIDTTRQERDRRVPRRITMPTIARVAAAAAIGVLLVGGALLMSGRPNDSVSGPPPSATAATTSSPVSSPEALQAGPLTAGTYTTTTAFPVPITVTVPNGWEALATSTRTVSILQSGSEPGAAFLGFWIVETAHGDPCGFGVVPDWVGPTVRDLAEALAGAPGFDAAEPTAVSVDGIAGEFVEMTGPHPPCTEPELWLTSDGSCRCMASSVERNRLWILEVDGNRLVIDALDIPASDGVRGTSAADLEELQGIIDSIQISR